MSSEVLLVEEEEEEEESECDDQEAPEEVPSTSERRPQQGLARWDYQWTETDEEEWHQEVHRDYYVALGLPKGNPSAVTTTRVRAAYHRLARRWFPENMASWHHRGCEVKGGMREVMERFWLITEAYLVLSDPERRRIYDECGMKGLRASESCYQESVFEQDAFKVYEDFFSGTDPEIRDFLLMNGQSAGSSSEEENEEEDEVEVQGTSGLLGQLAGADVAVSSSSRPAARIQDPPEVTEGETLDPKWKSLLDTALLAATKAGSPEAAQWKRRLWKGAARTRRPRPEAERLAKRLRKEAKTAEYPAAPSQH